MSRGAGRGNVVIDNVVPVSGTIAVSNLPVTQPVSVTGSVTTAEDNKAIVVYTSGSVDYVCKAVIGSALTSSVWQVRKIDRTTGVVITWADGNATYDNVATSLAIVAALSYS
jgi:hypothetical protein